MPSVKCISTIVARQRRNKGIPKLQPTCLKDLVIPTCFQTLLRHTGTSQFLQYDSGEMDSDRFIIFSTTENFELMRQANIVYSDGTLAVTLSLFEQLCTLQ